MDENLPYLLAGLAVLLLILWLLYRRSRLGDSLDRVLSAIAYERVDGLVIPSSDEGEIQIDHLLLTSQGLLILHIKDAQGSVFGGDKMTDWTVIAEDRRYTFSNPQPALYDRIAAVRQVVKDVPVAGRVLFLEGADFTKGVPDLVATLDDLSAEFSDSDKAAALRKIEAFKPHWEKLTRGANGQTAGKQAERKIA